MISFIQGIKKKGTNKLIYETERVTHIDNKLMVTKGEGEE